MDAAVASRARWIGLVFYPRSSRSLALGLAQRLAQRCPVTVGLVGLFVDASDAWLAEVAAQVRLDLIQLHGSETPERVAAVRANFGVAVMKAVVVGSPADINAAHAYEHVADWLLFDNRPSSGVLPGGSGQSFDWSLLAGRRWKRPWMLAGGLRAENLAQAVQTTAAAAVDVSSGVEDRLGHKSVDLIRSFLAVAAALPATTTGTGQV